MGRAGFRQRIGVVGGVFVRLHAPAGKEEAGRFNRFRDLQRGYWAKRVRTVTGGAGMEHTQVRGHGAHGIVAPMTAAAIGEDIFYPAPQRLTRVLDRALSALSRSRSSKTRRLHVCANKKEMRDVRVSGRCNSAGLSSRESGPWGGWTGRTFNAYLS